MYLTFQIRVGGVKIFGNARESAPLLEFFHVQNGTNREGKILL